MMSVEEARLALARAESVIGANLHLIFAPHTYSKPGRYTVAVKVIDIFGNDTMVLVPVNVD